MIVDDSEFALRSVADLIETYKDVELVGTASGGIKALQLLPIVKPDVAVVDLQMPNFNGLQTCSRIVDAYPDVRVVIMTAADAGEFEGASLAAGACRFVLKNRLPFELPQIVEKVHHELNPSPSPSAK